MMPTIADAKRRGAIVLVLLLGVALLVALAPYAEGVVTIPVFYIMLAPLHRWLARRIGPALAASVVIVVTILALVVLGGAFAGLVVNEAQRVTAGVSASPFLARLAEVKVGTVDLGAEANAIGSKAVEWLGSSAFAMLGSASRIALNLVVAFFGVFYLLIKPKETWDAIRPFIPFSAQNAEKLRQDFRDVTVSMLLGTGLSGVVQGVVLALAFRVAGIPNAAFWGLVTVVFSVLPILGAGMVWIPASVALLIDHRIAAAVLLALWGIVVVGNVSYVIQPVIGRRVGHIHPLVTMIGALIALPYFGVLGLLVGPLAISYFFELIAMFREEYLTAA
jgi:predicted PurR-regulated permease PerM